MSIVVSKFKVFLVIFVFFCGFSSAKAVSAANSSEFSVSIFIKASSVASKSIVAKAEEFRLVTNASGYPMCQIMSGSSWQTALVSSVAISADTWAHIVCTYDENELKIFVNGEEAGASDLSAAMDDTANMLKIGTDDSSGSTYGNLAGVVDEFKFFSFVLLSDEIKEEYNSGSAFVMGGADTADDNGTTVTGASTEYCIPGDTATCSPPVLELKFDKKSGATAYDTSGQGNDGTINGAAHSQGKLGAGLSFNGVDNNVEILSLDPSLDFSGNDPITITAWMKTTVEAAGVILNQGTEIVLRQRNSSPYDNVEFILNSFTSNDRAQTSGETVNDGKWHFVVGDYDGNNLCVSVDSKNRTCVTPSGTYVDSGNLYRIGGGPGLVWFDDSIDDVKIYNYARTPAQIAWDYDKGKPIAHYKFDECSGSTIHDESGNGNHGTLVLGATGVTATGTCASSSNSFWYNGRDGKKDGSGSFDGTDDYVNLGTSPFYEMSATEISVSLWVYYKSTTFNDSTDALIDSSGGNPAVNNGFYIIMDDRGGGVPEKGLQMVFKTASSFERIYASNLFLTEGWYHVLATYGDNVGKLYFNGEETGEITNSGSGDFVPRNADMRIGSYSSESEAVNAQIDEVKLWNYALTAEQVKNVYNDGAVSFH